MIRKALTLLVCLSSTAFATSFTANLKDVLGQVPGAFVRLELKGCEASGVSYIPSVTGTGVVVGDEKGGVNLFADATGAVAATVQDQSTIHCGNIQGLASGSSPIYYHVSIWSGSQTRPLARTKLREADYDIYGASFNLNDATFKNIIPIPVTGGNANAFLGVSLDTTPIQDGQCYVYSVSISKMTPATCSSSSGGHIIDNNGTPMPTRAAINLHGAGVTVTDSGVNNWTDVLINTGSLTFPIQATDGDSTHPVFSFASESTLGFYRPVAGTIGVSSGNNLQFNRLVSSTSSAPTTGGSVLLGFSDPIKAAYTNSDQLCGAVPCVLLLRKRSGTGEAEVGDHYGDYSSGPRTTAQYFASLVATGTPPLTVTSTTKVTNLNSEMWNGVFLNTPLTAGNCIEALDTTHLRTAAAPCGTGSGGAQLGTANTFTKTQTVQPDSDVPALIAQQSNVVSPVGDIQQWKDKTGAVLARLKSDGSVGVGSSTATMNLGMTGAPTGGCVNGSVWTRSDGGSGTTAYFCESGAWVAK